MSFPERDLQSKLDDMEADLNQQNVANDPEPDQKRVFPQFEINPSPKVQGWIDTTKGWFNTLPKVGKAAVAIGGVWFGFSVLGAIFHVVSSIISIGVVGFILYIGYRLFSSSADSSQ